MRAGISLFRLFFILTGFLLLVHRENAEWQLSQRCHPTPTTGLRLNHSNDSDRLLGICRRIRDNYFICVVNRPRFDLRVTTTLSGCSALSVQTHDLPRSVIKVSCKLTRWQLLTGVWVKEKEVGWRACSDVSGGGKIVHPYTTRLSVLCSRLAHSSPSQSALTHYLSQPQPLTHTPCLAFRNGQSLFPVLFFSSPWPMSRYLTVPTRLRPLTMVSTLSLLVACDHPTYY